MVDWHKIWIIKDFGSNNNKIYLPHNGNMSCRQNNNEYGLPYEFAPIIIINCLLRPSLQHCPAGDRRRGKEFLDDYWWL